MSLSDKDMKRLEEVCGHIEQLPLNERRRAVKSFDANIGRVIDSKEIDKWVDVVLEHFEESNAIGGDTYDRAV